MKNENFNFLKLKQMKRMKVLIATALFALLCLSSCRQNDDMDFPALNKTKKELLKKGNDSILPPQNLEDPTEPKIPPRK